MPRPVWMGKPSPLLQALKVACILAISALMLYPFRNVIAVSLAESADVRYGGLLPRAWSLEAYQSILRGGIVSRALLVSGGITVLDTYAALILPGLVSAFNLVVLRNFYLQILRELLEAARIDGCNDRQVYTSIVLPHCSTSTTPASGRSSWC